MILKEASSSTGSTRHGDVAKSEGAVDELEAGQRMMMGFLLLISRCTTPLNGLINRSLGL